MQAGKDIETGDPERPRKGFLERLGIVRIALGKDLLFFFLPFLAIMVLELSLCESHGDGVTGIWGTLWALITQPKNVAALPLQRTLGLALFIMGLTTMIVGQATLWRNYSGFVVIKRDHRLITHGIYRFTRNPIYLGAIIVFTGLPVYAASVPGLLTMPVLIPVLLNRIRMEEALLKEAFPGDFLRYKETTKKLIPFIY